MDKDFVLREIKIDYDNELKSFLNQNPLLDENYFIEFKLKGLADVILTYEKVGGFYSGDDEFEYGEKSTNRNLFGYYFCYRDFLISKNKKNKNVIKSKDKKLNANFIVGLKFATGEVYEYIVLNKFGNYIVKGKLNYTSITKILNLELSLRPFISDTISNSNRYGSKNIFKDKKVMLLLKNHCDENGIIMCQEFINKLEEIQNEKTK